MNRKPFTLPSACAALVVAAGACTAAPPADTDGATPDSATSGDTAVITGPGVSDEAIRILAINDLSGPAASGGQPVQAGLDAYIERLNDSGGIDGRKIELIVEDTQYDPQRAVQGYQNVRNDIATVWSYGTPTTDALRSFTEDDGMLFLPLKGPFAEANTFSVMNAWEVDTALLLSYVHEENPEAKLGVIYQADAMGDGVERGVRAVAEATGLEVVAETTVDATSDDMTAQLTAMRRAGADHILLGVGPGALIAAAGAVAQLGIDAVLLNPGSGYTRSLLDLPVGPVLEDKLLTSCSYPLWDEDIPAVSEFREALGDVEPHGSYINGWQSGMILEGILRQAVEDGDLSREGILEAARHTTVDMKDLTPPVSYGESINERTPYREGRVCVAVNDDDGFEIVRDWFTSEAAQDVELE